MKNSIILTVIVLFLIACHPSPTEREPSLPSDPPPEGARWLPTAGLWISTAQEGSIEVERTWGENRKIQYEIITVGQRQFQRLFNKEGKLSDVGQYCLKLRNSMSPSGFETYGRWYEFDDNGRLKREYCQLLATGFPVSPDSMVCGTEFIYGGLWTKKIEHPPCDIPCGRFIPGIQKGDYTMLSDAALMGGYGERPSGQIGQVEEGAHVTVLEDTHVLHTREGTTAPWIKIKLSSKGSDSSQEGYIWGGVLDIPVEQSFDFADKANFDIQPPAGEKDYCWREDES